MQEKINHYLDYIDYLIESEFFEKALKNILNLKVEKNFNLKYRKAICYFKLDQFEIAINEFQECLKFNIENDKCNIYIGLCYIKNNKLDYGLSKIENQLLLINNSHSKEEKDNNIIKLDDDLLCCPLTLDTFQDPYITPYGNTYEHAAIKEHLDNVGKFDPLTRDYLDESMIIPNRSIKELIINN